MTAGSDESANTAQSLTMAREGEEVEYDDEDLFTALVEGRQADILKILRTFDELSGGPLRVLTDMLDGNFSDPHFPYKLTVSRRKAGRASRTPLEKYKHAMSIGKRYDHLTKVCGEKTEVAYKIIGAEKAAVRKRKSGENEKKDLGRSTIMAEVAYWRRRKGPEK